MKQSHSWDLDDLVLIRVLFPEYFFLQSCMLHLIIRANLNVMEFLREIMNNVALGIPNRF
jgi:hypothetical protein